MEECSQDSSLVAKDSANSACPVSNRHSRVSSLDSQDSFLRALNEELPELSKQLDAAETILPPGIRIQTKPVLLTPTLSAKLTKDLESSSTKHAAASPSRAVRVPPPPGRGSVSAAVAKEPKPSRRLRRRRTRPATGHSMTRSASASSFKSSRSHASSHSRASERPVTPTFTFSRLPRFAPGPGVPAHISSSNKQVSVSEPHQKTPARVIRTTVPLRDEPKPRPQASRRHTSPTAGRRPTSRSSSRDSKDSTNSAASRRSHRSVSSMDVQVSLLQAQVASLTSQLHERDVLIKKLRKRAEKCTCEHVHQEAPVPLSSTQRVSGSTHTTSHAAREHSGRTAPREPAHVTKGPAMSAVRTDMYWDGRDIAWQRDQDLKRIALIMSKSGVTPPSPSERAGTVAAALNLSSTSTSNSSSHSSRERNTSRRHAPSLAASSKVARAVPAAVTMSGPERVRAMMQRANKTA